MTLKFYIDLETGEPHFQNHGVSEEEVRQILAHPGLVLKGGRNSPFGAMGQTTSGRYLKIWSTPRAERSAVFSLSLHMSFARQGIESLSPSPTQEVPMKAVPVKKSTSAWNEKKVRDVIAYYDRQTDEEGPPRSTQHRSAGTPRCCAHSSRCPAIARLIENHEHKASNSRSRNKKKNTAAKKTQP